MKRAAIPCLLFLAACGGGGEDSVVSSDPAPVAAAPAASSPAPTVPPAAGATAPSAPPSAVTAPAPSQPAPVPATPAARPAPVAAAPVAQPSPTPAPVAAPEPPPPQTGSMTCRTTRLDQATGQTFYDEIAPFPIAYRMGRADTPWSSMQVSGGENFGIAGDPAGTVKSGEVMPDGTARYWVGPVGAAVPYYDGTVYYLSGETLVAIEKLQRREGAKMLCQ